MWMLETLPQGPMQFGFRRGVGTSDAFFLLSTTLRYFSRCRGILSFACFVDLIKAFPLIYRSQVLEALREAGAPRNTLEQLIPCSDQTCVL